MHTKYLSHYGVIIVLPLWHKNGQGCLWKRKMLMCLKTYSPVPLSDDLSMSQVSVCRLLAEQGVERSVNRMRNSYAGRSTEQQTSWRQIRVGGVEGWAHKHEDKGAVRLHGPQLMGSALTQTVTNWLWLKLPQKTLSWGWNWVPGTPVRQSLCCILADSGWTW